MIHHMPKIGRRVTVDGWACEIVGEGRRAHHCTVRYADGTLDTVPWARIMYTARTGGRPPRIAYTSEERHVAAMVGLTPAQVREARSDS